MKKYLITPDMEKETARQLVSSSDFLFLLGGCPFLQMDLIKDKRLYNIILNYDKVMKGISAGAIIMSRYSIIAPCSEVYPDFDIREGFNLDVLSFYKCMI